MTQRYVVCAANRYNKVMVLGARHFDRCMHDQISNLPSCLKPKHPGDWEQGFIDQFGVFMTREEALIVATEAGQINTRRPKGGPANLLFSEDLY